MRRDSYLDQGDEKHIDSEMPYCLHPLGTASDLLMTRSSRDAYEDRTTL